MRDGLYVHLKLPDSSTVLVGQAIRDALAKRGWFRYAARYLRHPKAYALDPVNLPLDDEIKTFRYDRNYPGLPGVLLDAGPDSWGRKFLSWYKKPPPATTVDYLLAGSGTGTGALRFTTTKAPPPEDVAQRPFEDLDAMLLAAAAIERGLEPQTVLQAEQHAFFDRGAALGGARPKTLITHEGIEWIAKFPRADDPFNNPQVEHLTMTMAREAGLDVPRTKLVRTETADVLLVARFDVNEQGALSHMVSAHSLVNVYSARDRREEDFSYDNIFRLANRVSSGEPGPELFRRMVFNVACGNTDDHLNNHALLKTPDSDEYRLSPAYDLLPHPGLVGSHNISIGPMGNTPTADNIAAVASMMRIPEDQAWSIIEQVHRVSRRWREHYAQAGVSEEDIERIAPSFDFGLGQLSQYLKTYDRGLVRRVDLDSVDLSDLAPTQGPTHERE